jgi:hypothetical protein
MKKINSYYTDQQVKALQEIADMTGHTVAELLRRAVDMYLQRMHQRGMLNDNDLPPPVDESEFATLPKETIEGV